MANWVSSLLYAVVTATASIFWVAAAPLPLLALGEEIALVFGVSTLGGLALGAIRERCLSVWPGVVLQFLAGLGTLACWYNLPGMGALLP